MFGPVQAAPLAFSHPFSPLPSADQARCRRIHGTLLHLRPEHLLCSYWTAISIPPVVLDPFPLYHSANQLLWTLLPIAYCSDPHREIPFSYCRRRVDDVPLENDASPMTSREDKSRGRFGSVRVMEIQAMRRMGARRTSPALAFSPPPRANGACVCVCLSVCVCVCLCVCVFSRFRAFCRPRQMIIPSRSTPRPDQQMIRPKSSSNAGCICMPEVQ
jgi:hypothetical protein